MLVGTLSGNVKVRKLQKKGKTIRYLFYSSNGEEIEILYKDIIGRRGYCSVFEKVYENKGFETFESSDGCIIEKVEIGYDETIELLKEGYQFGRYVGGAMVVVYSNSRVERLMMVDSGY